MGAIAAQPNPDALFYVPSDQSSGGTPRGQSLQRRVLVIDDDIDGTRSLSYLLATMGHKVEYAINGIAALKMAQGFLPEIVILDLKLPDIHGAELARQLRRDPQLARARIVAITGSKSTEDRDRALAGGCDEVLAKPVPIPEFERILAGRPH
jgi:CheY-like chemotaxis protein